MPSKNHFIIWWFIWSLSYDFIVQNYQPLEDIINPMFAGMTCKLNKCYKTTGAYQCLMNSERSNIVYDNWKYMAEVVFGVFTI